MTIIMIILQKHSKPQSFLNTESSPELALFLCLSLIGWVILGFFSGRFSAAHYPEISFYFFWFILQVILNCCSCLCLLCLCTEMITGKRIALYVYHSWRTVHMFTVHHLSEFLFDCQTDTESTENWNKTDFSVYFASVENMIKHKHNSPQNPSY